MENKHYTPEEAREMLRGLIGWDRKQKDLAEEVGVSRTFISNVLKGNKDITDDIAALVGLERRIVFVKRGSK